MPRGSKSKRLRRAYGRRKFQTRKRGLPVTTKPPSRNLLPNVLGIASAVGYNENVLRAASSLSKSTRENYLTTMLRDKRLRYLQEQMERPLRYTTPLHNAINTLNVDSVRQMMNTTRIRNRVTLKNRLENQTKSLRHIGETPLEFALHKLRDLDDVIIGVDERMEIENLNEARFQELSAEREQAEEKIEKALEILNLILEKKPRIRPQAVEMIWTMIYYSIEYLLRTFPEFQHKSIVYKDAILRRLRNDLDAIRLDIKEYESDWNRSLDNYAMAPPELYDDLRNQEERFRVFQRFLNTQNPETKEFQLFDETQQNPDFEVPNAWNVAQNVWNPNNVH